MNRTIKQTLKQYPLPFFLIATAILGIIGIIAVYSMRLNYPPIRSDGLGYYLYLPAIFIYHDISLQSIAELFNSNNVLDIPTPAMWANDGPSLWKNTSMYVIKYPMGTALLMLPFFLCAVIIASVTSAPVDGFSPIFQYVTAISGLCYGLAGIAILWKVLEKHFKQNTIFIVMLGLVFGTNLFHYATYDSVFSHIYSFFLFSAFLYIAQKIYSENSPGYFILAGAVAGFIIITRPTNGLWLLFGILYGVDSFQSLAERIAFWKRHALLLLYGTMLCTLVISLQLIYWKITTGHFVIFSYQNEHFNLTDPQIFNILFSVRKGLFFWSPVLLLAVPGFLFIRKRAREFVTPIIMFLPLNIYVISSWHSWFYGGSFGHRAFIESFPLFAISFCAFYEELNSPKLKRTVIFLTFLCVMLSTWLMLKYWTGVIPFDGTTWDYFLSTFFIFSPQ